MTRNETRNADATRFSTRRTSSRGGSIPGRGRGGGARLAGSPANVPVLPGWRAAGRASIFTLAAGLWLGAAVPGTGADETAPGPVFTGRLGAMAVEASALGPDWAGPTTSQVFENLQDLSGVGEGERLAGEHLAENLSARAVRAVASFSYAKKSSNEKLRLRALVFPSREAAESWWKSRFQADGWEEQYRQVKEGDPFVLEAREYRKRLVLWENVVLTSQQLFDGQEYVKAIETLQQKLAG